MTLRRMLALALVAGTLPFIAGCATVRPYQREHLSSRIMTFDDDAKAQARSTKSLEAREGSTGGVGGAGGGCACK